jgi:hypothetical protein
MKNLVQHITEKLQISRNKYERCISFDDLHSLILDKGDHENHNKYRGYSNNRVYFKNCLNTDFLVFNIDGTQIKCKGIYAIIEDNNKKFVLDVIVDDDRILDEITYLSTFNERRYEEFINIVGNQNILDIVNYLERK